MGVKQTAAVTAEQFRNWQWRHELTNAQAANQLGISLCSVEKIRQGTRPVARPVALLMSYLDWMRLIAERRAEERGPEEDQDD